MTRRQKKILALIQGGGRLWRYSTSRIGWLWVEGQCQSVQSQTIHSMLGQNLIEEDPEQCTYRASSGSDIVYKIKEKK